MKWKNELANLGLDEKTVSQGVRNRIRNFEDVVSQYEELKETLRNPSLNDNVDDVREALENAKEDIQNLDDELVDAIRKFHKNKDSYAAKGKKMLEARANKKSSQSQTQQPQVQTQAVQKVETPITPTEEVKDDKKKKTNWGWVAFAVIGGIVTLGAVNLFRDRD